MQMNIIKKIYIRLYTIIIKKLKIKKKVLYIGGNDSLPPPLSIDEEKELLAQKNDCPTAKSKLIEHNLRLVVYIAKNLNHQVLM